MVFEEKKVQFEIFIKLEVILQINSIFFPLNFQDLHVVAEAYSAQYIVIVINMIAHLITRSLVLKKSEKATQWWSPAKFRKSKSISNENRKQKC